MKKMTSKLALLMAALLLLVGTVLPAFAEGTDTAPDADEEAVIIGYDASLVQEEDLTDVADIKNYDAEHVASAYKITDVDGYKKFVEIVNSVTDGSVVFGGVTIYLADDLDISEVENQQPIGYFKGYYANSTITTLEAAKFGGTFDGQGHSISGINITGTVANREQYVAFFGWTQGATIKNVQLFGDVTQLLGELTNGEGPDICGCAGVVACGGATFYNVYSDIDVTSDTVMQSAGFVGRGNGACMITFCTNMGDINGGTSACAAGFTGFSVDATIGLCLNAGNLTGGIAGGIVARSRCTQTISYCVNVGNVLGNVAAGGILGAAEKNANVTVENCTNYGTVSGTSDKVAVGAIFSGSTNNGTCTVDEETCEDKTGETYIPTIVNPTEDYCGYSSARIDKVDTTQIPDIKNIVIPDSDKELIELEYKAYKITDVEGFQRLDDLLSNFLTLADITIYLANDVDFSDVDDFSPIGAKVQGAPELNGNPLNSFRGTFDGLGHMVKGVHATMDESNYQKDGDSTNYGGLSFFAILGDATIKNFIVEGSFTYTADPNDHGCVAGFAYATTGGLTIDNCLNLVTVNNGSRFSAGFVARPQGNLIITNSTNAADIWGCQSAGGFVGMGTGGCAIANCRNIGNIHCIKRNGVEHGKDTLVGSDHAAAGIVAWAAGTTSILGCINDGDIFGVDNVAGIVGEIGKPAPHGVSLTCELTACFNFGKLSMDDPKNLDNAGKPNEPLMAEEGMLYAETNNPDTTTVAESADLRGTFDPTVGLEVLNPDFTPEADFDPSQATTATTEATAAPSTNDGNGGNAGSTTAATTTGSTTATPTTAGTTAGTTAAPSDEEDGGCGSTVIGGLAIILLVSGAAVTMVKKKED